MRRIKKILKDNAWVLMAIVSIATLLLFFYMIFGFIIEVGMFHAAMNAIAG